MDSEISSHTRVRRRRAVLIAAACLLSIAGSASAATGLLGGRGPGNPDKDSIEKHELDRLR